MKQKYQLQILTPVHIGSGETLNFMDGCYANGRWYHIDLDKVLAHPSTDLNTLTSEMSQRGFRWERYLQRHNTDLSELSAYSLLCLQSPEEVEIREAIKTTGNRPYIPGSTLKGAIRTMLLWDIVNKEDEDNQGEDLYKKSLNYLNTTKAKQPAQWIERQAFGKNSNYDLLRALQISDTAPLESNALEIGMARTVTVNQNKQLVEKKDGHREFKNFVQQIQNGQCSTFTLKIDEWLFGKTANKELHFEDPQINAIQNIADVCYWVTGDLIEREQKYFDSYDLPRIANFYDKLTRYNEKLPEGAFLLQIGWGTGYHANTVTSLLADDEESSVNWMDLRKRFKLGESRSRRGDYDEREFPKTRRILYRGQNPIAPLGWVKILPLED